MVNKSGLKICLAASAGGHLSQLLKLAESWSGRDAFYVTTARAARGDLEKYGRVYIVGECNRRHPIQTVWVFFQCLKIAFRERPQVVISTGAAPGLLLCFAAKLTGAKIVWIDSIANVERLSLSGYMVRYFADICLTQWPELAERYGNVEYEGAIV